MRLNGSIISNYSELSNAFNDHFSTIGPCLANEIPPNDNNDLSYINNINLNHHKFSFSSTSISTVFSHLNKLCLFIIRECADLISVSRDTQRQFSESICSEDDLRSRVFGTCLSYDCRTSKIWYNCPFFIGFLPKKGHLEFSGAFFLVEIFEKVSFDPYNFRTTKLSARKFKQIKNFSGIKICLYLPFIY